MGLRFYKRVNYGNGLGLNISKSSISPSIRTKSGSFGFKGFSIRSGIPGLSYRGGFGKNGEIFWLVFLLLAGIFIIIYNILRFIAYILSSISDSIFKSEGIDYANLTITLSSILGILIIIYFFI